MWWWQQIPHRELGPIRGPLPNTLMQPRRYGLGQLAQPQPPTYRRAPRVFTASEIEANRNAGGTGIPMGEASTGEDVAAAERAQAAEAAHLTAIGERQPAPFGRALGAIASLAFGGVPGAFRGVIKDVLGVTIGGIRATTATPTGVIAPDAPLVIPDGVIFTDPITGFPSGVLASPTDVPAPIDEPVSLTDPQVMSDAPSPVGAVSEPVEAVGVSMADLSIEAQREVNVSGPGDTTTGQVGQDITSGGDFGSQAGSQAGADASGGTGGIDAGAGGESNAGA